MSLKDEILGSLNFYQVIFWGIPSELTVCTYRPKESIYDIFNNADISGVDKCEVWDLNSTDFDDEDADELFPIFCVELHTEYNSIDSLIEDIMVWRLSGMMDREMEGMQ